ncbi:hypothetical protein [Roseisalinus antarcticus]|uniref:Uncharacterized protein n=1 Tax=Roseisalinus antarcticus TaxID=254357 RepID=A0A1Y5RUR6_9RHOB|nr:hypothetical protein [Roseisalinus antarcticus]SLN25969.1 hypothetical protein ROA7023_00808 [Roseisalinus antarcticus]
MEILFAILIFLLAACGIGLGLALGRGPVRGSCGGLSCVPGAACGGCARGRARSAEETSE